MTGRLAIALIAFVTWAAITIVLGNILRRGEITLLDAVTHGVGWSWLIAAAFILAVMLWQGWRDVGLDRLPDARGWRSACAPALGPCAPTRGFWSRCRGACYRTR